MTRVHLRVRGRVQGVYFRATTARLAEGLGLVGWVRNRHDGSVEVVAEGEEAALHQLVAGCHQGPPMARVDDVEITWGEAVGLAGAFEVRPTA